MSRHDAKDDDFSDFFEMVEELELEYSWMERRPEKRLDYWLQLRSPTSQL
jgi:hypothetical protein